MAETAKSNKSYRGYSMKQWKGALLREYYAWYNSGHQDGVINLIGPAGIGKTEGVHQLAELIRKGNPAKGITAVPNAKVTELFLSALMDPESAAGTPVPVDTLMKDVEGNEEKVKVLEMAFRKELVEAKKGGKGYIIFVDELGREPDQLRPLLMKLLHEKLLGGLDVNDGFLIVAGNPSDEEHNVSAIQEDAALSSRLIDINCKSDVKELANYLYKRSTSHKAVADFLLENPSYMHGRDSENDQSTKFHSPRSWFNAGSKLHIHGKGTKTDPGNIKAPEVAMVLSGLVGKQAFAALRTFMSKDRPLTVSQILKGEFQTPLRAVPPAVQQALKTWLCDQDIDETEADNVMNFLDNIPADRARAIMREAVQGNIRPANNQKLVARGCFKKFLKKVGISSSK